MGVVAFSYHQSVSYPPPLGSRQCSAVLWCWETIDKSSDWAWANKLTRICVCVCVSAFQRDYCYECAVGHCRFRSNKYVWLDSAQVLCSLRTLPQKMEQASNLQLLFWAPGNRQSINKLFWQMWKTHSNTCKKCTIRNLLQWTRRCQGWGSSVWFGLRLAVGVCASRLKSICKLCHLVPIRALRNTEGHPEKLFTSYIFYVFRLSRFLDVYFTLYNCGNDFYGSEMLWMSHEYSNAILVSVECLRRLLCKPVLWGILFGDFGDIWKMGHTGCWCIVLSSTE